MAGQADGTVLINTKINTDGVKEGTADIQKTVVGVKDSLKLLPQAFKDLPNIVRHGISSASKSIQNLSPRFRNLQDDIDRYEDALYRAEKAGYGLGDAPYDKAYAGLQKAKKAAEDYKKQLSGVYNNQKKTTKSGNKMNKSLKNTEKSARGARMSVGRMLATSLLISTVFRAITTVASGLKEGLDNLAQYSSDTNKALSSLMSAMTRLKNAFASAFAPLIQYVEPALTSFINHLAQAVTYVGKLFAALTGKTYFEQAKEVQQDYADSLDKTSESAEKASKTLASFDEAEVLNFGDEEAKEEELKPEDMFETVQIGENILSVAEKIKAALAGLFNPIKESWLENGPYVLDALSYAGNSIKNFAVDAASSFMQVWNAEGYGKAITDDILITFGNLVNTVGNLVTNLDKAWVSGNAGTTMLRLLGDIVLEVTGFFREASNSIMEWSANIDFTPLLTSFNTVLAALRPVVGDVGDLLLWLLDSILLPLAKWGIEQAVPTAFELIAAALRVVHSVIQALKPLGEWLWENFLLPLGQWTGSVIISALETLTSLLTRFSDWINENQEVVQNATVVIAAFFAAWEITKMLSFIQQSGGVIEAIGRITTAIAGSTIAKVKDIAETAILNAMYAKDFVVSMAKAAAAAAKTTSGILGLTAAVTVIVSLIAVLAENWDKMTPTEKVISGILAAAAAVGILAVALGAIGGAAGAAVVAAALAAGIAAANIAINAGKRQVQSYQSSARSRSSYSPAAYSAVTYSMPRLATGTVVPPRAGEFAAILGDNNRETEVVSPLSTMKQALKEALLEAGMTGNSGSSGDVYLQIDGKTFARLALPYMQSEEKRVGVRLVTGGAK